MAITPKFSFKLSVQRVKKIFQWPAVVIVQGPAQVVGPAVLWPYHFISHANLFPYRWSLRTRQSQEPQGQQEIHVHVASCSHFTDLPGKIPEGAGPRTWPPSISKLTHVSRYATTWLYHSIPACSRSVVRCHISEYRIVRIISPWAISLTSALNRVLGI